LRRQARLRSRRLAARRIAADVHFLGSSDAESQGQETKGNGQLDFHDATSGLDNRKLTFILRHIRSSSTAKSTGREAPEDLAREIAAPEGFYIALPTGNTPEARGLHLGYARETVVKHLQHDHGR
jgi:hypothetical protein